MLCWEDFQWLINLTQQNGIPFNIYFAEKNEKNYLHQEEFVEKKMRSEQKFKINDFANQRVACFFAHIYIQI